MSIIENFKEVADLVKKVGDIELYRRIIELEGEVIEVTRENRLMEAKVEQLESLLRLKEKMDFREPFYFYEGDSVPYCPRCWEADKKAVHVVTIFSDTSRQRWDCPQCSKMFLVERSY